MRAVIGIYAGQEDNVFCRRSDPVHRHLTESGGKVLRTSDIAVLGDGSIHGVIKPTDRLTGAIHVYGGDFANQPRSQWVLVGRSSDRTTSMKRVSSSPTPTPRRGPPPADGAARVVSIDLIPSIHTAQAFVVTVQRTSRCTGRTNR
jgi:hypothetical protein